MRQVAGHRQVLCVTHLAGIAALAHHHFVVSKAEVAGRTETSVRRLGGADRRDEIARMMGGAAVTAEARAHAEAMLAAAAAPRAPGKPAARPAGAGHGVRPRGQTRSRL